MFGLVTTSESPSEVILVSESEIESIDSYSDSLSDRTITSRSDFRSGRLRVFAMSILTSLNPLVSVISSPSIVCESSSSFKPETIALSGPFLNFKL